VSQDDKYLGINHNTKDIDLKPTSDITWSWSDTRVRMTDQSPEQVLCVGPDAQQVRDLDIEGREGRA
jgi:hypothetical protein